MKGDFTRSTFKRKNHYRSVRMQQGRVQLDSDWNEQADINNYHVETDMKDVIGRCGAPFHKKTDVNDIKNFEIKVIDANDFEIAPGHIFVNGILCENDPESAPVRGSNQPDLPPLPEGINLTADMPFMAFRNPPAQFSGGTYLAFLDVWQRHVTYLDDTGIREVALGGPDTATRAKTIWQVKLLPVGEEDGDVNCLLDDLEFNELVAGSTGKLSAKTTDPGTFSADPCILPSGGGYRRLKNQLYRVEIHDGGNRETATFKWSRDNGTVVVKWDSISGDNKLKVIDPGRSILSCFAAGKWVELTDDIHELWGLPGTLVKLTDVSGEEFTFDINTKTGSIYKAASKWNPKIRLWDSEGAEKVSRISGEEWVQLGDEGIQVRFETGTYRTGDYWLIPARTEKADIEWPFKLVSGKTEPEPQEPHGIKHHYCRLALLEADEGGSLNLLKDCRKLFPSLTELTSLSYVSGDGQEAMPGHKLPEPLKVGVANGQWPVKGALVRFEIETAGGVLTDNNSVSNDPLFVETGDDGVAQCEWTVGNYPYTDSPDTPPPPQRVKATLVDANHNEEFRLPVFFNANLSVAGQVAYFPQNCTSMNAATTVQNAIDTLSHLTSLSYVSGDGQEAMPGEPLPLQLQVMVVNDCAPVNGAVVKFVAEGKGRVAIDKDALENEETPNTFYATTGTDGIAGCYWQLEEDGASSQTLNAKLQSTDDNTPVHEPSSMVFTANLSIAAEVAYTPPSECTNLANDTTVQEAIDRLSQLRDLYYISGDGQEAMPGHKLPKPLQVRVASKCGLISKAKVRFEITDGYEDCAHLEPGTSEVIENTAKVLTVLTGLDGVAECYLKMGKKYEHQVEATLIDPVPPASDGKPINIRFNANLSVAREVAYDPQDCNNLEGIDTVQQAIDRLCKNSTLYYVSGDGQEAMPDQKLPEPFQVRVSNGKWPVIAAHVKFTINEGYDKSKIGFGTVARLEPGRSTVIEDLGDKMTVLTGSDGIAECYLKLGDQKMHRVEATLLDVVMLDHAGDPILNDGGDQVHPSVNFNASLSAADEVAYFPPSGCTRLANETTVQMAIDKLALLTGLSYMSGDGQEAMPGEPLPRMLEAIVTNECGPLKGAEVTFEAEGKGRVAIDKEALENEETTNIFHTTTGPDGVAGCYWLPDENGSSSQTLKATLTEAGSNPIHPLAFFVFTAGLSIASEVAYVPPEKCPDLKDIKTVQTAIDMLCYRKGIPENLTLSSLTLKCIDIPEEKWPELRCEKGDILFVGGEPSPEVSRKIPETMRISADGKVGIGITDPSNKLSIGSSSLIIPSQVQISHQSNDWGLVIKRVADDNGNANLAFLKSRGESATPVRSGDSVGRIAWHAVNNDAAPAAVQVAQIGSVIGTVSGARVDGDLRFHTKELDSPLSERMRIDQSGNVGIGTAKPFTKLHIVEEEKEPDNPGYGNPWILGKHIEIAASQMWGLKDLYGSLCTWDSDSMFVGLKNEGPDRKDPIIAWGDNTSDSLRFMFAPPGNPAPDPVEIMRLEPGGNVSIGNLTVNGDITVENGKFNGDGAGITGVSKPGHFHLANEISGGTFNGGLKINGNFGIIKGDLTIETGKSLLTVTYEDISLPDTKGSRLKFLANGKTIFILDEEGNIHIPGTIYEGSL